MGRTRTIKREPTTTVEIYLADGMLIDDFQKLKESKPEAIRRMFLEYFGKERVEEKRKEIRKKLDRDYLLGSEIPDQSTIDNMYYPRKQFKDLEYKALDLLEIVKQAKRLKGELSDRNAADSIQKAINRGDAIVNPGNTVTILRKWF